MKYILYLITILYFNDLFYSDYYSTTDPPSIPFKPIEMSCCAARYSVDDRWYRARIKRYSSGIMTHLFFIQVHFS
jgi:hypothetical protein